MGAGADAGAGVGEADWWNIALVFPNRCSRDGI